MFLARPGTQGVTIVLNITYYWKLKEKEKYSVVWFCSQEVISLTPLITGTPQLQSLKSGEGFRISEQTSDRG